MHCFVVDTYDDDNRDDDEDDVNRIDGNDIDHDVDTLDEEEVEEGTKMMRICSTSSASAHQIVGALIPTVRVLVLLEKLVPNATKME
jgi:hypothetical protein